jgi:hypothetical protein
MTWQCTICPYETSSFKALQEHCLQDHNAYQEKDKYPKDMTIETLNKLRTVKQQVHWLYINKPATKGDDNMLILEYLKYFQDMLIYIPESQRIAFKNPNGITYEQFIYMITPETLTRCGRLIRADDKKFYHGKDGSIIKEHLCLLGTPKTELRRQRRAEIYKNNIKYM